jgi:hypothetical protein
LNEGFIIKPIYDRKMKKWEIMHRFNKEKYALFTNAKKFIFNPGFDSYKNRNNNANAIMA